MPKTRDQWKGEDLSPPPEYLQPPDTRLEEVPRDIATFRRPEKRPENFLEEILAGIATFRSPEKSSGRSQKRPEGFFGGSIKRNATFRSLPHLAIIIL